MLRLDRQQIEEKKLKIRLEVFSTKSKQRVVKDKQRKRAGLSRNYLSLCFSWGLVFFEKRLSLGGES